jgi:hypothetical protein
VFDGPYPGFTAPSAPGETDKELLVATHLKVFQEQVRHTWRKDDRDGVDQLSLIKFNWLNL